MHCPERRQCTASVFWPDAPLSPHYEPHIMGRGHTFYRYSAEQHQRTFKIKKGENTLIFAFKYFS